MAIFSPLTIGRSALLAHQRALRTTGQNIANVSTEGYSRQEVHLQPAPGSDGFGVHAGRVERMVDRFIEQRLLEHAASGTGAEVASELHSRVESLVPFGEGGLASSIDGFFGATQRLASHPEDLAVRAEVLGRAADVAAGFRSIAGGLGALQREVDDRLRAATTEINERLREIAHLSERVTAQNVAGADAAELEDQLGRAVHLLAEDLDLRIDLREHGGMDLSLRASGAPLVVGGIAHELGHAVGTSPAVGGGFLTEIGLVAPDGQLIDPGAAWGGRLGALVEMRDQQLPARAGEVDALAVAFASAVNAIQTDPAANDLDGATGTALFSGAGAGDMQLVLSDPRGLAASRTGLAGDNGNALALAALQGEPQASIGGQTFAEAFGTLHATIGDAARRAGERTQVQERLGDALLAQRDAISGVSLEEEMTNLLRYQRGFQAAARLIDASNRLLDDLLGIVR